MRDENTVDGRSLLDLRGVYARINAGASFSGHERNHLFLNRGGESFVELSGISGLDHPQDARASALLDFDRDGWQDIAIVNANAPLLRLLRNRIGEDPAAAGHRVIAVRFVGGNDRAAPSGEWSSRDGYGALVRVELPGQTLIREHRCGEGFSAQNSRTMVIGIGVNPSASTVTVRWPSGVVQQETEVAAGTLLTAYENPDHSPEGTPFTRSAYARPAAVLPPPEPDRARLEPGREGRDSRLRLYTTMATWCVACREEIPELEQLGAAFDTDELSLFGIPVDEADSAEMLSEWMKTNRPPYELTDWSPAQVDAVESLLLDTLKLEGVPATLVTDNTGAVLLVQWGPPTISQIRGLLLDAGR